MFDTGCHFGTVCLRIFFYIAAPSHWLCHYFRFPMTTEQPGHNAELELVVPLSLHWLVNGASSGTFQDCSSELTMSSTFQSTFASVFLSAHLSFFCLSSKKLLVLHKALAGWLSSTMDSSQTFCTTFLFKELIFSETNNRFTSTLERIRRSEWIWLLMIVIYPMMPPVSVHKLCPGMTPMVSWG